MSEDGTSIIDDWIFLEEVPAVNIVVQTLEGKFGIFNQKKYGIPGETLSPVGGFIDAGESPLTSAKREVLEELGLGSRQTLQIVEDSLREYNENVKIRRNELPQGADKVREIPRKNLDLETAAHIITQKANPPVFDKFGLLDGSSNMARQTAMPEDTDWIFLGRYRTAANRGGGFLYSFLLKNAVPLIPGGGTVEYQGTGDGEAQQILYLSKEEVMKAISEGRFQEIKWAATFALAMLHLDGMPACSGSDMSLPQCQCYHGGVNCASEQTPGLSG